MTDKKTILTGIQPSGRLHVGNYFGMIKPVVELQGDYDTYVTIVNYHALTTVHDAQRLSKDTLNVAIDYLASGFDPAVATLFVQSDLPEVTELAWILNTLVTVPYLERGVSYKDKIAKGIENSAGLLTYPVLQAADILIMNADLVPVGEDQQQHLEYARGIAEKFNNAFGQTFALPKAYIRKEVAIVPGTDGQKMSKSYSNIIPLFATDEEIEKAVMSIPTDSRSPDEPKNPEKDLVYAFHKLFSEHELGELKEGYEKGGLSYKESKEKLIENISAFVVPMREKREQIAKDKDAVIQILKNGVERARSKAVVKMHEVREKIGLKL